MKNTNGKDINPHGSIPQYRRVNVYGVYGRTALAVGQHKVPLVNDGFQTENVLILHIKLPEPSAKRPLATAVREGADEGALDVNVGLVSSDQDLPDSFGVYFEVERGTDDKTLRAGFSIPVDAGAANSVAGTFPFTLDASEDAEIRKGIALIEPDAFIALAAAVGFDASSWPGMTRGHVWAHSSFPPLIRNVEPSGVPAEMSQ
jgi:hypothetical protein